MILTGSVDRHWLVILALVLAGCSRGGTPAVRTVVATSAGPVGVSEPPTAFPPIARTAVAAVEPEFAEADPTTNADGARMSPTGRLSVPRASHSATLLPDGRVLIAGGCTLDSCELAEEGATAEIYDPDTGSFVSTGSMITQRVGHTATPLPRGQVLLSGGWDQVGVVASAEVYDPRTGDFTATGSMGSGRGGFTATALRDGRVLIVGGYNGDQPLRSAELYDPRTGTFTATGALSTPRSAHVAVLLPDGRVLVAGGSGGEGTVLASAEIYDPVSGSFRVTGEMSVVRHKHAAVSLASGEVLVLGGSDARDSAGRYASAEIYDPQMGVFSPTMDMEAKRFKLPDAVATLKTGKILIAGGGQQAEVYDPKVKDFRIVEGSMGSDWSFATATRLADDHVLVVGGYGPGIEVTASAWLYRPAP